jgi:hypothetical protein
VDTPRPSPRTNRTRRVPHRLSTKSEGPDSQSTPACSTPQLQPDPRHAPRHHRRETLSRRALFRGGHLPLGVRRRPPIQGADAARAPTTETEDSYNVNNFTWKRTDGPGVAPQRATHGVTSAFRAAAGVCGTRRVAVPARARDRGCDAQHAHALPRRRDLRQPLATRGPQGPAPLRTTTVRGVLGFRC